MTQQAEKDTMRRRQIAKAGRIFIIVMIILTFLSKTIINMTLPKVDISRVRGGELNNKISGNGRVVARKRVEYHSDLQLPVKDIKVEAGDRVERGELLIVLDNKRILEQIEEGEYLLKLGENNLKKLLLDREDIVEEDFATLKLEISYLESEILNGQNKDVLIEEKKIKKEELEKRERSQVRKIEKIDIEINNQKLDTERLQRQMETLKSNLDKCQIRAETNGVIEELDLTLNEVVISNKPLYIMAEIEKGYEVVLNLPSKYENILEVGQKAMVNIYDKNIQEVEGVVDLIKKGNRDLEIELTIEIDGLDYNVGSRAETTIIVDYGSFDIVIPNTSIHKETGDRNYVFVLEERDGAFGKEYYAVKRDVELVAYNNHVAGIRTGLDTRDVIIASSNKTLKDGMRVVIND